VPLVFLFVILLLLIPGLAFLFLRSERIRNAWLFALLAIVAVLFVLLIGGSHEEVVEFALWQVTRTWVLFAGFNLPAPIQVLAAAVLVRGLVNLTAMMSGSIRVTSKQVGQLLLLLGFTLAGLVASNSLALVLMWMLFDAAFIFRARSTGRPFLRCLLTGAASIGFLIAGSVVETAAIAHPDAAFLQPSVAKGFLIIAAFLRLIAGRWLLPGGDHEGRRVEDREYAMYGALAWALLVRSIPFGFTTTGFSVVVLLLSLLGFGGSLFSGRGDERRWWVRLCQLAIMLVGTLLPAEVQSVYFAAAGVLWVLTLNEMVDETGWSRWAYLILPLSQVGLPFTAGGIMVAALFSVESTPISLLLAGAFGMGGSSLLTWRVWKNLRQQQTEGERLETAFHLAGVALVGLVLIYAGWRLGYTLNTGPVILGGALVVLTFALGVVVQPSPEWMETGRSILVGGKRIQRRARGMLTGLLQSYSYVVGLVSDILEGDGGTLWIIIFVLIGMLTLRSQGA